jgi:hypothetical protein
LRTLFCDGYIFCEPDTQVPGLGEAKTITQIALAEFQSMVVLRYGRKTKCLWSATSKKEAAEVLAEISSVAKDTLDRLAADFHDQDLYMAFESFHLPSWRPLLAAQAPALLTAPPGEVRAATPDNEAAAMEEKRKRLLKKAKACCSAVEVIFSERGFVAAVRDALRIQRQTPSLDARSVWARVCTGEHGWLAPVVAFYVTHPDGTGDVERGLGLHARLRGAHLGADGNSEAAEVCAEIRCEGPQDDSELFRKGDCNDLRFTPFSRRVAELWVQRYGRRFACQKRRSDAGVRLPPERRRGTLRSVSLRQKAAANALLGAAAEDARRGTSARRTVMGPKRASLVALAGTLPPAESQSLANFRKTTKEHLEQKVGRPGWAGFGDEAPQMRRKPGARTGAATPGIVGEPPEPQCPAVGASSENASAWVVLCGAAAPNGFVQYMRIATPALRAAATVVVDSLVDLETARLDDNLLVAWLFCIGEGKQVRARRGAPEPVQLQRGKSTAMTFHLTERFREKHGRLVSALVSLCGRPPESRWSLGDSPGHTVIDTLACLRDALVTLRRLPLIAGVQRSRRG